MWLQAQDWVIRFVGETLVMRPFACLLLLFAPLFLLAQPQIAYQQPTDPSLIYRKISRADLLADIRFWRQVQEDAHVNVYHSISRQQMDALIQELTTPVTDSISQTAAIFLFSKLGAALDEGHVGLVSSRLTDSLFGESIRFPFMIKKTEADAWVIAFDLSAAGQLQEDDRIITINGHSVRDLNDRYTRLFGGLPVWKAEQVAYYARKLLYLDGIRSPYTLDAVKANGEKMHYTTAGYSKQQTDSINKVLQARLGNSQKPYEFRLLPGGIGYLNYRSMRNDPANPFETFLKNMFTQLKDSDANGLVIDLRDNGGGDSKLGEALLRYFNTKPYRFASGMKWKISAPYKEYLKTAKNFREADNKFYMSRPDGDMYTWVSDELVTPQPEEPFFRGKVAFLIGSRTFSSANMLADGVTAYQLARTFGEPTGEVPNDFGEMFNYMLPRTQIIARGASKMFTRANGDEKNFDPVKPDVFVKPSSAGSAEKRDAVLDSAVNWIQQKQ